MRGAAGHRQPARDQVGVDDDGAEAREHRPDRALAAADAAGETDAQGGHASADATPFGLGPASQPRTRSGPANRTTSPAPARKGPNGT